MRPGDFVSKTYSLTGHLHFLFLLLNASILAALVSSFLNCFWANPVWFLAVVLSSLDRPWKSKQISFALEADVLWKSFCLFSSMADSFLQQSKGFNLVRSCSQKLASWILTREPLHKPDVILQDKEVPAASGRILEHLSLLRHSEVISLLSIVIITHSKCCCLSLTFLQPPVGLTVKANEESKEGSLVCTASGTGRAEGEWLPYAIHDCKSRSGRLPLSYQDKQNMSLLSSCNFPRCPELCRWQPGRGNGDSSAHKLMGLQYTIVTGGDIFQNCLCTGGFEMFLTWGYLPMTTAVLCSCKNLQNKGKVPAECDVQTPAPALSYVKNSFNLLLHLVEQRWVVFMPIVSGQLCQTFGYT